MNEQTILNHIRFFTITTAKTLSKAIGIPLRKVKNMLATMEQKEKLISSMEYDPSIGAKEIHYHVSPNEERTELQHIDKSLR